jgi:hypothetical protein
MNQRIPAGMLSGKHGTIEPPPAHQATRICWRPVTDWVPLDPPARTDTIAALRKVFGAPPCTLTEEHLPSLRAMAAVGGAHYGRLARLVEERGRIEISIEDEHEQHP